MLTPIPKNKRKRSVASKKKLWYNVMKINDTNTISDIFRRINQ